MKSIGMSPPRDKRVEKLKRAIWAEQCNQRNKPPIPQVVLNDQMGAETYECDEPRLFDCCECGEPFQIGKGFIHDGSFDRFWCEPCFREMAQRVYKEV